VFEILKTFCESRISTAGKHKGIIEVKHFKTHREKTIPASPLLIKFRFQGYLFLKLKFRIRFPES